MTDTWFIMIPPSYASKSDAEKELVDFMISYTAGSPAWIAANSGKIVQGAEGNTGNPQVSEQLVKWKGPFATEAEAKTAQAARQQSTNPVNDAVNAAETSNNPLSAAESDVTKLFDANTWLRVTKVIGGGIILIVGLAKLTGLEQSANGAAGKAIKSAVKVAPLL